MLLLKIQRFLKNFFQVLETLIRVLIGSKYFLPLPKHVKQSDQMIILGNGPSLTRELDEYNHYLSAKDLICVNNFPETDLFQEWKPVYYILAAPELWREKVDDNSKERSDHLFKTINEKTNWPLTMFIPWEAKKFSRWQSHIKSNKSINVTYFNNVPVEGWKWFRELLFKLNLGMPRPHNVFIPAILLSINMKYNRIYLLGADHSWLGEIRVNDNNEVLINQRHFYDQNKSEYKSMHKLGTGKRNLSEVLHKFMTSFNSYYILNDYSKRFDCKILTSTKGSYIDAFDRYYFNDQ
ncbi:hypothetical protein ACFLU5_07865 [Bacteroidota bacterium]